MSTGKCVLTCGNLGVLLVTTLKSGCLNDTVCDISLLFTETMQVVLLLPL